MIDELSNLDVGEVLYDVDLKNYTTYKLKGKASVLVRPNNTRELMNIINFSKENKIRYKIIGLGANLIFASDFDGILIKLDKFNNLEIYDNYVIVGAGYNLPLLATKLSNMGYSGLEFAVGIPGTIGGAVFNNAGAYKRDMSDIVKSILVLDENMELKRMTNEDLNYSYRSSYLKENPGYICLEALIHLIPGNKDVIEDVIESRRKRRMEAQPLNFPSAGSVFRNPEGDYAGRLIEELGYKGKKIGGAMVSEKHANFIVNTDNATGEDIKNLIEDIKLNVKKKYGVDLILEQEIVK